VVRAVAAGLGLWLFAGTAAADLSRDDLRELEELLARLGFDPGPVDGIADTQTAIAIRGYQSFAALKADGKASPALLAELRGVTDSLETVEDSAPAEAARADAAPGEPAPPEPTQAAGFTGGAPEGPAVHLASFRHEAKAHEEWQRLQRLLPSLLSDMMPSIQEIDLGEEGLFFRLYARPFPNLATAQDFCVTISLQGYNCRVVNGQAAQVAAAKPVAEEVPDAPSGTAPEGQPEAEPAAREAEPAAREDDRAPEAVAAPAVETAEARPVAGADAPDPSPKDEEIPAVGPPEVADTAATAAPAAPAGPPTADDAAAAVPFPEGAGQSSPATEVPTEPKVVARAGAGAPTILVTADQFGGPPGRVGMVAPMARPSIAAVGGPTVLVASTRFTEMAAGESSEPDPVPMDFSETGAASYDPAAPDSAVPGNEAPPAAVTESPAESPAEMPAELPAEETQTATLVETGTEDYTTAQTAFESGDCATAVRYYAQAFETGGLSRQALAAAHNNRGRCLFDRARYDEALADFDQAIALDRDFAAAYYNRGRVHNALGDSDRANADLGAAYLLGFGRLEPEP
jgi:hypothetical protein